MQKYIVKGLVKANEKTAKLRYTRDGRFVETKRAIYQQDGIEYFLFKGIKIEAKFNNLGYATNLIVKEIYDEKVKKEDSGRLDKISLEIKMDNNLVESIKKEVTIPPTNVTPQPEKQDVNKPVKHAKFDQIKLFVDNNIPTYLYGPAGSGKNHVLQQIADELGLDFYFTNSVQQEFKITGFIDAGGKFHETEFYRAFTKGGLFFLDEMDASIPEVLVLLNAALANGYFEFPTGKVDAHKDFRVVAAGNTVGTGADEQYSGRLQLDQATLDRFAMIEFDYDRNIELAIAKGNVELVNFIRDLRRQSEDKGIQSTYSYRCITMVTRLEGKMPLSEIIKTTVVKGLDKDTLNTITTTQANKYSKALWVMQQESKRK